MGINVAEVERKVTNIKINVERQVVQFFQAIALQTFNYISANSADVSDYGSPVLTGRFYVSHTIGINEIDTTTQPINPQGSVSPYKAIQQSTASGKIQQAKLGDKIFIANSLPYANRLENYGWSAKTPDGIYKVAAQLVSMKFKDVGIQL